jgi:hypothetical protein
MQVRHTLKLLKTERQRKQIYGLNLSVVTQVQHWNTDSRKIKCVFKFWDMLNS